MAMRRAYGPPSRVDPPVNVRRRSSNHVSEPFPRAYTLRVLPRDPWCRDGLARRPLKRRANRLGPWRVVASGVHQNQLQKSVSRAQTFFTTSCDLLRELWSGRRDAAPLGGIAQRTQCGAEPVLATRCTVSAAPSDVRGPLGPENRPYHPRLVGGPLGRARLDYPQGGPGFLRVYYPNFF